MQGQLAETLGRAKALGAVLVSTDRDFAQIKELAAERRVLDVAGAVRVTEGRPERNCTKTSSARPDDRSRREAHRRAPP